MYWNLLHEFMEPIQSSLLFEFVICTTARNVKERDIPTERKEQVGIKRVNKKYLFTFVK